MEFSSQLRTIKDSTDCLPIHHDSVRRAKLRAVERTPTMARPIILIFVHVLEFLWAAMKVSLLLSAWIRCNENREIYGERSYPTAGHESKPSHQSSFCEAWREVEKSASLTWVHGQLREIDKSHMCVESRGGLLQDIAPRRFGTVGLWRRNIWYNPGLKSHDIWRLHRNVN